MKNRIALIVSGLPYSGKSWLLKRIAMLPEFAGAACISQDLAKVDLYGNRADHDVSKSEHLFKNHWMRCLFLRELVLGAGHTLVDTVLLTHADHQKPMLATIKEANSYAHSIALEHGKMPVEIQPKIVLCYTAPDVIVRRLGYVNEHRAKTYAPHLTLKGLGFAYSQFEFPTAYNPLYIDTSDESDAGTESNVEEVMAFVNNRHDGSSNSRRAARAMGLHQRMLEIIAKA